MFNINKENINMNSYKRSKQDIYFSIKGNDKPRDYIDSILCYTIATIIGLPIIGIITIFYLTA